MPDFRTLLFAKDGGIASVTLNRPEVLNVYNLAMRDDLFSVGQAIRDDPEIRAVIFQGAGEKAFCAGADLSEFLTAPSPLIARRARWSRDVWGLFLSLRQPLIAALHGYVLGSGLEIALCCDLRIASGDSRFGLPEVGLGIIPAAGGSQTLPRTISRGWALDMLLTNRWLSAEEAHGVGLVNQVVARERLLRTAQEVAKKIASFDAVAVEYAKEAVVQGLDLSLREGLSLEKRISSRVMSRARRKVGAKGRRVSF